MKVEFSRKIIIRFIITVFGVLVVSYVIHRLLLSEALNSVLLLSYVLQLLLSVCSFLVLSRVSMKKGEQTGFFFLGQSALKFLVYIVGFRLYFTQDGIVTSEEYAVFFVPYIIAFITEVAYLIFVLNTATLDPEKIIEFSDEEE